MYLYVLRTSSLISAINSPDFDGIEVIRQLLTRKILLTVAEVWKVLGTSRRLRSLQ
jgi:hypothetical protein